MLTRWHLAALSHRTATRDALHRQAASREKPSVLLSATYGMGIDEMIRCLIALLLKASIVATLSSASGKTLAAEEGLSVTINPILRQIVPYEPLLVAVVISNRSKHTLAFDPTYHFSGLVFWCGDEDKPLIPCAYGRSSVMFSGIYVDSAPGKLPAKRERRQEELLFWRHPEQFNGKAFVFSKPGRYRVKAKSRNLESNVVEVKVRQPSPKESAAARLFTPPRVARLIQGDFFESKEERKKAIAELDLKQA